jgi:YggT family protein
VSTLLSAFDVVQLVARQVVLWLAAASAVVAGVDALVRTRRINPFNPVARFFRGTVDPLMAPVERRIVRAGGNPTSAPWWTMVVVVVGGILFLAALDYVRGMVGDLVVATAGGALPILRLAVHWTFLVLELAIIVRVLSSWFGLGAYSRWVRWSYPLTEWMLRPLRRIIPPMGMFDVSPIVAWFGLSLLEWFVMQALSLLTRGS